MFCRKGFPKNFKKFSEKYLCRSQESLVKAIPSEFCGIFKNIFCRPSVNAYLREMKQWKIVLTNVFTENHWWWCPLKYSSRIEGLEHWCLQFYLKGTDTFFSHRYFLVKLVTFCRASVLHNTTYYLATASDFQQHFWRIAFFISNVSIQSQLVV